MTETAKGEGTPGGEVEESVTGKEHGTGKERGTRNGPGKNKGEGEGEGPEAPVCDGASSKPPRRGRRILLTPIGIIILIMVSYFASVQDAGDDDADGGGVDQAAAAMELEARARVVLGLELETALRALVADGSLGADRNALQEALLQSLSRYTIEGQPVIVDDGAGLMLFISDVSLGVEPAMDARAGLFLPGVADTEDILHALTLDSMPVTGKGTPVPAGMAGAEDGSTALGIEVRALYSYSIQSFRTEGGGAAAALRIPTGTVSEGQGWANVTVDAPVLFFRQLAERLEGQCTSGAGDVARTVRYLLTTLARQRAAGDAGMSQTESPRNILNEGDVELALNLALLLQELLIFGALDTGAVSAIDGAYYLADNATAHENTTGYAPDNPTGRRQWGEGEARNHDAYLSRRSAYGAPGEERTMESIFDTHVAERPGSVVDPADLLALYLYMDHWPYEDSVTAVPDDGLAILEQEGLFDPLDQYLTDDFGHITQAFYVNGPWDTGWAPDGGTGGLQRGSLPGGWTLDPDGGDGEEEMTLALEVAREPSYLVAGDDFTVTGVYPPKGWYTTASADMGGTRTGGIPITRPLPSHDFRLQWDLRVQGSYILSITTGDGGGRFAVMGESGDGRATLDIVVELDFPVEVTVWLPGQPLNNAVAFEDLNKGGLVGNDWFYTNESIAYEGFRHLVWPYLREAVGNISGALQEGGGVVAMYDTDVEAEWGMEGPDLSSWSDAANEAAETAAGNTLHSPALYAGVELLMDGYIIDRQIDDEYLTRLTIDGYNVAFGSFDDGARFSLTFEVMDVFGRLDITGFRGGADDAVVEGWWTLDLGKAGLVGGEGRLRG